MNDRLSTYIPQIRINLINNHHHRERMPGEKEVRSEMDSERKKNNFKVKFLKHSSSIQFENVLIIVQ